MSIFVKWRFCNAVPDDTDGREYEFDEVVGGFEPDPEFPDHRDELAGIWVGHAINDWLAEWGEGCEESVEIEVLDPKWMRGIYGVEVSWGPDCKASRKG